MKKLSNHGNLSSQSALPLELHIGYKINCMLHSETTSVSRYCCFPWKMSRHRTYFGMYCFICVCSWKEGEKRRDGGFVIVCTVLVTLAGMAQPGRCRKEAVCARSYKSDFLPVTVSEYLLSPKGDQAAIP